MHITFTLKLYTLGYYYTLASYIGHWCTAQKLIETVHGMDD